MNFLWILHEHANETSLLFKQKWNMNMSGLVCL